MHRSPVRGVLAACALVLASLGAAPTPTPTGSGEPADPLARFHAQQLSWGACPDPPVPAEMRCTVIQVPLDYAAPGKGTVEVAMGRIPATDPKRRLGSLLLNYGGPGGPGIESLAFDTELADLNERYDLIAFDPRGVAHSDPVTCEDGTDPAEGVGEDWASQLAALRAAVKICERASGPVLQHMGTVDVSRDMDVIRRVLGDEKLNFLGFSYGARLGAVYAAQFPHTTGRMVLDGVDTLTEPLTEQALVTARAQQRALDNFLTWCAHQSDCVYGTNTRTAREKVNALVTRLDEKPLVGEDGTQLTGLDAVQSISSALYSPQLWPSLAEALEAAERDGDPAGLIFLGTEPELPPPTGTPEATQDATATERFDPVPADNLAAALEAVNCADDPDRPLDKAGPAEIEKQILALEDEFLKASPIFGPVQLGTVLSCYGRPDGTDFIRKIDHPGAPPMLLVGTRGDPATPYEWTEETAERLDSAVIVDHKGDGHTGYQSSSCVRNYVADFLLDGQLPSGTRSCPAEE
ncbi:alpha/beta hydrolase [Streptomyces sp. NPDC054932]